MPQVRFPGSKNFLPLLAFKILSDKYDSSHEITFSDKPTHPTGCVDVRLVHLKSNKEKWAALPFTGECFELSSLRS